MRCRPIAIDENVVERSLGFGILWLRIHCHTPPILDETPESEYLAQQFIPGFFTQLVECQGT
jgi:hypothetical protein